MQRQDFVSSAQRMYFLRAIIRRLFSLGLSASSPSVLLDVNYALPMNRSALARNAWSLASIDCLCSAMRSALFTFTPDSLLCYEVFGASHKKD
jgi:hypothetical protein